MTAPSAFERALDRAVHVIAGIGFLALVFIAFLTVADTVLRYLGVLRLPGFKDLGEVAYAIVIASSFPAGLKKGNAVTIRLLGKLLGARPHAWLDLFGALAMLTLFGLFSWQFADLTLVYQGAGRTTSTLEWRTAPVWWLVTSLMVACVVVQAWVTTIAFRAALAGVPIEPAEESIAE